MSANWSNPETVAAEKRIYELEVALRKIAALPAGSDISAARAIAIAVGRQ